MRSGESAFWRYLTESTFFLVAATIATRLSGLVISFYSGDEATYSALSSRILEGALPYSGAVDHKPVGIVLTYTAIYGLFERNQLILLRILLIAVVAVTGILLGRLGELLTGHREGRFCGLMYVLASSWGLAGDVQAANTELFLNLPLVLAALLIAPSIAGNASFQWIRFLAAGMLTAVAGLYKYQASLAGAAWASVVLLVAGSIPAKGGRLAALAIGFLSVVLPYLGFYYLKGTWDSFVFWGWKYNFQYMAILSWWEVAWNAVRYTAFVSACWAPLLVVVRGGSPSCRLLALPWLGAMFLAVAAGGRFFPHYYLMLLPPLSLLASPLVLKKRRKRLVFFLSALCLYSVVAASVAWGWYSLKPHLARYDKTYRAVGAWIGSHSSPTDRIFVWGNSPEIYYYSNRVMGTRFPFCNYHTGRIWGTRFDEVDATGTEANIVPRAWRELMEDLNASPPLYLVDAASGRLDRFDLHPISRYRQIAQFAAERCRPVARVAGVPIYCCRQPAAATLERSSSDIPAF